MKFLLYSKLLNEVTQAFLNIISFLILGFEKIQSKFIRINGYEKNIYLIPNLIFQIEILDDQAILQLLQK